MAQAAYTTRIVRVRQLDESLRKSMAVLYLANYDGSTRSLFLRDLANKQDVLLLYAGTELVGFTTIRVFVTRWQGRPVKVVYSGDTVVDRSHWGQQALAFNWISYVGTIRHSTPELPLYWFLLVKGHRTFRYLPVFGKSFFPHWSTDRSDLKPLADMLATDMFAQDYNPATGVVEFPESRGHLKSGIAEPTAAELDRDGVRFFLEKNPGFRRGHELVCICEIEEHNLKPLALRLFRKLSHAA